MMRKYNKRLHTAACVRETLGPVRQERTQHFALNPPVYTGLQRTVRIKKRGKSLKIKKF